MCLTHDRGWTAKFISKNDIKPLFCDHEPLRQAMVGRPSYGKQALGLSYFGIQHTAGAPLFLVDSDSLDFDMGGFDLDGADEGYDDFEDHLDDDEVDWEDESLAIQGEDYLDGVTPQDESENSDQSEAGSNIDVEEVYENDEVMASPGSLHRSLRSSHSSGQSTPHDDSRYGVESAQDYLSRQQRQNHERLPRMMSARAAASLRELRLSAGRRDSPNYIQADVSGNESDSELEEARGISRSARTRQFLTRIMIEDDGEALQLLLQGPMNTSSTEDRSAQARATIPSPIEIVPGGWGSDESVDQEMETQVDDTKDNVEHEQTTDIYPDAIPRPFTSPNVNLDGKEVTVKEECICNLQNQSTAECLCPAGNDFPDQLVMLTTGKNVYLMDPRQRMKKLAVDKNILADIDLRTDRMLCLMDRLNLTEVRMNTALQI